MIELHVDNIIEIIVYRDNVMNIIESYQDITFSIITQPYYGPTLATTNAKI